MNEKPLRAQRLYLLKHTTQMVQARVRDVRHRINVNTLATEAAGELHLNEIGQVVIEAQRPIYFDPYRKNRATGSFILIDPLTNETVGAGMISGRESALTVAGRVTPAEREAVSGHSSFAICLPQANPELAWALERQLFDHGCRVHVIDNPEGLTQAVRTAHAAGLISIVLAASMDDIEMVKGALPADRVFIVDNVAEDEYEILHALENSGRISAGRDPLTGGSGI
jgi:hypothetical protein